MLWIIILYLLESINVFSVELGDQIFSNLIMFWAFQDNISKLFFD